MAPQQPSSRAGPAARTAVGIDVGGSGIKGGVVDLASGEVVGERLRDPTPEGFEPDPVIAAIADLAGRLSPEGPIGIGFPAVVSQGRLLTNPTALERPGWAGRDLAAELAERAGREVSIANDADVAALAEHAFGAAVDRGGTVLVLTLGTGIGTGLLRDGRLLPNLELGRIYLQGDREVAEEHCAARIRDEQDLSWEQWAGRLQRYLGHIERILAPDLIVIGGGISKDADRFMGRLETWADLVAATLLNNAGIVGAATLTRPEDERL